ncbi:MAG: PAS domain-containing hybrid sensor histidine kinase/response regulator [Fimbriimonas sp.]
MIGTFFVNRESVITWANTSLESLLGYAASDLIGLALSTCLFGPQSSKRNITALAEAIAKGTALVTPNFFYRKDGTYFWGSMTVDPKDVGGSEFICTLTNVGQQLIPRGSDEIASLSKQALEFVGDGYWELGLREEQEHYASEWKAVLGFRDDEIGSGYWDWASLVHPQDLSDVQRNCQAYLDGETTIYRSEHRMQCSDGSYKWLLFRGQFKDYREDGKPSVLAGTVVDVSERWSSKRQFEALVGNLPGAVFQYVITGTGHDYATYMSPGCYEIFGYKSEELLFDVSIPIKLIPTDEERELFWKSFEEASAGQSSWDYTWRTTTKTGEIKWVHVRSNLERQANGHTVWDGFVVDVTNQVLSEERFRNAQRDLSLSQSIAKIGGWKWIQEPDIVTWTDELYRIFGLDPSTPAPTSVEHPRLYSKESFDRLSLAVQESIASGTGFELGIEFLRADGTSGWGIASGKPLLDSLGKRIGLFGTLQDVTDRHRSEREVQDLQARFLQASDLSNTGLWDWDLLTNEVQYSKVWKSQIGYEDDEISNSLSEWSSRLHPDDRVEAVLKTRYYISNPEGIYESVFRIRHRNGSYRWILSKGSVMNDDFGKPTRFSGCHIDITERREAELKLRQVQHRNQALFDNALNAIMMVDTSGRYIDANPAACKLLGYSRDEFMKLTARKVIARESFVGDSWREFLRVGFWTGIAKVMKKDRSLVTVEYNSVANVIPGVHLTILSDISERQAVQEALQLARFSLDHAAIGLYWVRPDGTFIDVNATAHEALGYTKEELMSMHVMELNPDNDTDAWDEHWIRLSKYGSLLLTTRQQRKDGSIFHVEIQANYFRYGDIELNCAFVRDITNELKAAADHQMLEAQLRESQKMEAIGTLAGGVAHDFNNILAVILGNAELARQDTPPESPALESLAEIMKAATRARALVQQILAFSRRQAHEPLVTDLGPLVRDSLSLLRAIMPAGVALMPLIGTEPVYAKVDITQINQVLMNLCTNAWQAMPSGQGELKITLGVVDRSPDLLPEIEGPMCACLSVEDDGLGIQPEHLERIFEPFFTTKGVGQGTGLGLSVVHGIVKAHGGAIRVKSVEGEGTTFSIFLPLESPAIPPGVASAVAGETDRGVGQRIMYVDDEDEMVFLVRRFLQRQGYKVRGFQDPMEALAEFRENPGDFDLVVTDQNMPGYSGVELVRKVQSIRPEMPVALISGYLSDELIQQAEELGVTELIYKPNTIEELCEAISNLLPIPN